MAARSSNTKIILLVVVGVFLMCGFGAGGLGLLVYLGMNSDEVGLAALADEEREMLVTFDDVAGHFELERTVGAEKVRRGGFLGSKELEYEYEDPGELGIYLLSSLTMERTPKEARETFTGMHLSMGLMLGIANEGLEREERNDLFRWGDASKHYLLLSEGTPVGNFFLARKGRHIYFLSLGGVAFEDPEALRALLEPRLERAAVWTPP